MYILEHTSITDIHQYQWNELALNAGPFLQYEFLHAIESSGSINNTNVNDSGWQTCILGLYQGDDNLVALVPGYKKTHSYGEYVFDHGWANAFAQHGLHYYPKWIAAVPFTPVTGSRILCKENQLVEVLPVIRDYCGKIQGLSSMHWLFHSEQQQAGLNNLGMPTRYSVQFQWQNRNYGSFDDFLTCFKSRKRKDIKKERAKANRGITIERLHGEALTQDSLNLFYLCYKQTYLKRSGHTGYLTADFFKLIINKMPNNIMLVLARDGTQVLGASLFFFDNTGLFGRYWGALQERDCLHFECCYYQGIEFAIEQQLPLFNPGTQGEHKLLRGFEPFVCRSSHYIRDERFQAAIDDFLVREKHAIKEYYESAYLALPFNESTLLKCNKNDF